MGRKAKEPVCNRDSFNCIHPDCILDEGPNQEEYRFSAELDHYAWLEKRCMEHQFYKLRAWYRSKLEYNRQRRRAYYQANREREKARQRAYSKAHREEHNEWQRAYRQTKKAEAERG